MTKRYWGLVGALSAIGLLAAACGEGTQTGPSSAPAQQPAPLAGADAQAGLGFDLATAPGREAAKAALGEGWHEVENTLVWQASRTAKLTLSVPPGEDRRAMIYIGSFLPEAGMTLDVDVAVDGQEAKSYLLESGSPDEVVTLDFPPAEQASTHEVTFNVSQLVSPSEKIAGNPDTRQLGISLRGVGIEVQ